MKIGDERDERDAFFLYQLLHARAPEGSTAKSVTVVTVVTPPQGMSVEGKGIEPTGGPAVAYE